MESFTGLLSALSGASWPLITFIILIIFRKPALEFFESLKNRPFQMEIGGHKITFEDVNKDNSSLIYDLQKSIIEIHKKLDISPPGNNLLLSDSFQKIESKKILWVNDEPKSDYYLKETLQNRGYQIDLALNTNDGIKYYSKSNYRLIISDMGREESNSYNEQAGLLLLETLQANGLNTPFLIFTTENNVERFKEKAKNLGAFSITSSPLEMIEVLNRLAP